MTRAPSSDPERRAEPTFAESKMWDLLRSVKSPGLHFRRQGKVGGFTVDFICRRARLAIEVDGGIHRIKVAEDAHRQAIIEAAGYRVLRFSNDDVIRDPVAVRGKVLKALSEAGFSGAE